MLTIQAGGKQKLFYGYEGDESTPICLVIAVDEGTAKEKAHEWLIGETKRRNEAAQQHYKRQGLERNEDPLPTLDDINVVEVLKEEIVWT